MINGLSFADLQRRALPLVDRTQDPEEWRYRSAEGFIGSGEVLMDVIAADEQSMSSLGYKKEDMANLIRNAITEADKIVKERFNLPFSMVIQEQDIEVTKNWYMSPQYSMFYNESMPESEYNESWQFEYHFKNLRNGLEIIVGGDRSCGIIHYIEWLGFCEGGHPANAYRLDPYIVIAVIKGKVYEQTLLIVQDQCEYKLQQHLEEQENIKSFIIDSQVQLNIETNKGKIERIERDLKFLQERYDALSKEHIELETKFDSRISSLRKEIDLSFC